MRWNSNENHARYYGQKSTRTFTVTFRHLDERVGRRAFPCHLEAQRPVGTKILRTITAIKVAFTRCFTARISYVTISNEGTG